MTDHAASLLPLLALLTLVACHKQTAEDIALNSSTPGNVPVAGATVSGDQNTMVPGNVQGWAVGQTRSVVVSNVAGR